jgi:hypothetical protein
MKKFRHVLSNKVNFKHLLVAIIQQVTLLILFQFPFINHAAGFSIAAFNGLWLNQLYLC